MDLIRLVVVVAVVSLIVWLIVSNFVKHDLLARAIYVVTAIVLGLYVLRAIGVTIPNLLGG